MADRARSGIERVGEVEIAYEQLGDPDGEPLLLIMGLGMQMLAWDERFCALLGERGFRVIRFDNRDVGRSSWTIGPLPRRLAVLIGIRRRLAYTLAEMAGDAAGLLDRLGIGSAHVVGASMGGMIAQVLGFRHRERVRSLGLIMTGAGKRHLALPRVGVLGAFLAAAPSEREAYADHVIGLFRLIGSPGYPVPEAEVRRMVLTAYDRGHNPVGVIRQLHAINASGDRSRGLRTVEAPTVVIHGTDDPLVRPISGRAMAREIPDSRLLMIEGMGHDLPPALWPRITEALADNAARVAPRPARAPLAR